MAEMVGSAVVQEGVSRAVSCVVGNLEEKASKRRRIERLAMAHAELELALERSRKLPITDGSLLRQRRMVKRAYEECGDVLQRCKLRVVEDDEGQSFSSLPRRIFHAARSIVSSPFSSKKDDPSSSDVARFEWFADKAGRFVRDVQTGCSLSHYRFLISCPLTKGILELKSLWYQKVEESQKNSVMIRSAWSEHFGVQASILFVSKDSRFPNKNFVLSMFLRPSETSGVMGIVAKCLRSLAPVFRPFAEFTIGELTQLSQLQLQVPWSAFRASSLEATTARHLLPDASCCRTELCANTITTSSSRFPVQVLYVFFRCNISAFEYSLQQQPQVSAAGGDILAFRDWPPLELIAIYIPHALNQGVPGCGGAEIIGRRSEHVHASLPEMEEMVVPRAIDRFIHDPDLALYQLLWCSLHGEANFLLRKQSTRGA